MEGSASWLHIFQVRSSAVDLISYRPLLSHNAANNFVQYSLPLQCTRKQSSCTSLSILASINSAREQQYTVTNKHKVVHGK